MVARGAGSSAASGSAASGGVGAAGAAGTTGAAGTAVTAAAGTATTGASAAAAGAGIAAKIGIGVAAAAVAAVGAFGAVTVAEQISQDAPAPEAASLAVDDPDPDESREEDVGAEAVALNPGETLVELTLEGTCPTECIIEAKNGFDLLHTLTFSEMGEAQSFVVETDRTRGMYFTIHSVESEDWAVEVVTLRPVDTGVGESVGEGDVVAMPAGYVCWAGSQGASAAFSLVVAADYEESIITPGLEVPLVKAWAAPAVDTVGEPAASPGDGHISHQNILDLGPDCQVG